MFTNLIAFTEEAGAWDYDLTITHQSPVDPRTLVSAIQFVRDKGEPIVLHCNFWNSTDASPIEWIKLRNRLCAYLQHRMYEIRTMDSLTRWPVTKWHFERHMRLVNKRCRAQMNWTNYGKEGWHIHHLLPMACFDLRKRSHRLLCQSLANLRPVWAHLNYAQRNIVTIGDVTRYVNGRLKLRAYRDSVSKIKSGLNT
jgi:hypothetical protein